MMLNSIVAEESRKNKRKKKNTKLDNTVPLVQSQVDRPRKVNTPVPTKGLYPCRVHNCTVSLPSARLLNHVRSCHSDVLTEGVVDFTDNYNQTWLIPFENKQPLTGTTVVVFVRGIGLIFLNIEILKPGSLIAVIQMALKLGKSRNFLACIDFFNDSTTYSYNTRIPSVRDNTQSLMEKKMCYTLSHNQMKRICVNKTFKCKLRLSPFNEMESNVLTVPNRENITVLRLIRGSVIQKQKNRQLSIESEASSSSSSNKSGSCNAEDCFTAKDNKTKGNIVRNVSSKSASFTVPAATYITIPFNVTQQSQNEPAPPPNEPLSQGISRRQRRRRRNRGVVNGTNLNII